MNEALTLTSIGQLFVIIGALAGLWWRVETRISQGSIDAMKRANEAIEKVDLAQIQISDFRLEVAENYAKNGYLKDVETRIIQRFDAIVSELHGMRTDFQTAMLDLATSKTRSARNR
jgi:hypothetical protein